MSIDQIQFGPHSPADQLSPDKANVRPAPSSPDPSLGKGPKTETAAAQSVADPDFVPAEEVKVQRGIPTGEGKGR